MAACLVCLWRIVRPPAALLSHGNKSQPWASCLVYSQQSVGPPAVLVSHGSRSPPGAACLVYSQQQTPLQYDEEHPMCSMGTSGCTSYPQKCIQLSFQLWHLSQLPGGVAHVPDLPSALPPPCPFVTCASALQQLSSSSNSMCSTTGTCSQ